MGRQERERHRRLEVGGLVANHIRLAIELELAHARTRRKIEAGKLDPEEAVQLCPNGEKPIEKCPALRHK